MLLYFGSILLNPYRKSCWSMKSLCSKSQLGPQNKNDSIGGS